MATYSFYDANFQRKNMTNYCPAEAADPGYQTSWGVDLNRNFTVGSAFDGYVGDVDHELPQRHLRRARRTQ